MHGAKFNTIKLPLPNGEPTDPLKEVQVRSNKTALYVPARRLNDCGFQAAFLSPNVLVTNDVLPILTAVSNWGEVDRRFSDGEFVGLEEDTTKKQVILYTAIVAQNHLLWYQRAGEPNVTQVPLELLGDDRLLGKYSVGFGGHKAQEDIKLTHAEKLFLAPLVPGLVGFLQVALGTARGLFAEVEEELGIKQHDIRDIKLLGAFMDNRITDPDDKVQVGQVHLCLPVIIDLDPNSITELRFNLREVARTWWMPLSQTRRILEEYEQMEDVIVESWTEVLIKEFLSPERN